MLNDDSVNYSAKFRENPVLLSGCLLRAIGRIDIWPRFSYALRECKKSPLNSGG